MRVSASTLFQRLRTFKAYLWNSDDCKLVPGMSEFVRIHLAYNRNLDPQDFIADPSWRVRARAARRKLSLDQQQYLLRDPSPGVRKSLATSSADISTWRALAQDPVLEVRMRVANRQRVPLEIQEILLSDVDDVRYWLAINTRTDFSILKKLGEDTGTVGAIARRAYETRYH